MYMLDHFCIVLTALKPSHRMYRGSSFVNRTCICRTLEKTLIQNVYNVIYRHIIKDNGKKISQVTYSIKLCAFVHELVRIWETVATKATKRVTIFNGFPFFVYQMNNFPISFLLSFFFYYERKNKNEPNLSYFSTSIRINGRKTKTPAEYVKIIRRASTESEQFIFFIQQKWPKTVSALTKRQMDVKQFTFSTSGDIAVEIG